MQASVTREDSKTEYNLLEIAAKREHEEDRTIGNARENVGMKTERRPERPDVVLAVRFINEFTRLNHRLKNVYEVTVRSI